MGKYIGDRRFYSRVLKVMIPIVIQQGITNFVGLLDNIMVGQVGTEQMSGVAITNQLLFIFQLCIFGSLSGAGIFCAQYFGKGDQEKVRSVFRYKVITTGIITILAMGIFWFFREPLIRLFLTDTGSGGDLEATLGYGKTYLEVMMVGLIPFAIVQMYSSTMRETGETAIPMKASTLAVLVNMCFNYILIFGKFGAPKLGATGVAIATAVSRLIELAACVIVSFLSKDVKLNLTFMFIRSKVLFGDFIRLSLPALGNDISWSVAFSMYSVILGHLGTDAVAANSLVTVVRNIGSVFCFAIASAGTILLGNVMGKGDLEKSKVYASRMLKMTIIAGAIGGVIVFAITPLVLRFASLSDGAMHYLKYMLLINTYYIMGSAVNTALIAGVFRAGGDTKFGLICDTIDMWVYAVPLGFFAAFVLKLPVLWVYFLLCTDEFVKWPWVFHHYRQGKWAQNITRENLFEQKAS